MQQAITLGTVIAAGKDAGGTLYVVDRDPKVGLRLFVSRGSSLYRERVYGGGMGGSGGMENWIGVTTTIAGAEVHLMIEIDDKRMVHMGLVRGHIDGKTFAIGAEGEVLQVVTAESVLGMSLVNLPGTVNVEYLATTEDGRRLVVTRPEVDWTYEDFRLFLGPPPELIEREIAQVARGTYTTITFSLAGSQAVATFGSTLNTAVASSLTVDGKTQSLSRDPSGTPPTGLTFLCR